MEPRAASRWYARRARHLYRVHSGRVAMRDALAVIWGAPEKIRVNLEEVGGGFGVRSTSIPSIRRCCSRQRARPSGEVARTRSEVFLADEQAATSCSQGELALDASGRFVGHALRHARHLGAYLAPAGPFINSIGIDQLPSGVYDVPAAYAPSQLVLTNTAPTAAYRGAGRPDMSYTIERLVELPPSSRHRSGGVSPAQLHPKNSFPTGSRGLRIRLRRFRRASSTRRCAAADWEGFAAKPTRIGATRRAARARHVDLIEATGAGFAPQDQVELRWGEDDRTARSRSTPRRTTTGRATRPIFPQLVAGVLGIAARIGDACAGGSRVLSRGQSHRRLALAARGGQRATCSARARW